MIQINDIPRIGGAPIGNYRLRVRGLHEPHGRCPYVDGVSVNPVTGRALLQQYQSRGPVVTIEPWERVDAEIVAAHMRECGKGAAADSLLAHFEPAPIQAATKTAPAEELAKSATMPAPAIDTGDADEAPQAVDLDAMGADELRAFAAANSIDVDGRLGVRRLRRAIARKL